MKEGDIYKHKKGFLFQVTRIYNEPTIIMRVIHHKNEKLVEEQVTDTKKVWDEMKMEKIFP